MAKLTLNTIGSRYGSIDALNANFDAIETALENTLSRDGTLPNNMDANLDMDSNRIINLADGIDNSDAVTLRQVNGIVAGASSGIIASLRENFVATAGQTVFNIASFTYNPGSNNLAVYIDGVRQYPGSSYTETDNNTITFSAGLHVGALVMFISNQSVDTANLQASAVHYNPAGTGAVATNVQAKLRTYIDAQDYIATPGVSDALDQAGVQAAINYANSIGGAVVRVRPPISTSWNIQTLTVPVGVMIEDLRRINLNNVFLYGTGGDTEYALSGTSVTGGEGPSFVLVNNATSGDRTSSLVARYGNTSTGASVNCYMHMGVWDSPNWYPEFDMITSGSSGYRSNFRAGYGAAAINAGASGAYYYTQNQVFVVNRPPGFTKSGSAFVVGDTVSTLTTELKIADTVGALRFCYADATPMWSWLSSYPSTGNFTLYDQNLSSARMTFISGAETSHRGTFQPFVDNSGNLGAATFRWNTVYAGTGAINTSDARQKQQTRSLSDVEKAVAVKIKGLLKAFKFNDAVKAKGDKARWHFGVMAQDVKAAFESEGLDASNYGLFCYDEWGAVEELKDEQGNVSRPAVTAGNAYGVRYDELFTFVLAAI